MHTILHKAIERAFRAADTLGDLVADMALGFGAVAPLIAPPACDASDGPSDRGEAAISSTKR